MLHRHIREAAAVMVNAGVEFPHLLLQLAVLIGQPDVANKHGLTRLFRLDEAVPERERGGERERERARGRTKRFRKSQDG